MNITEARINGDFRSEDCTTLLKQADIVVTNPPFSLFRDFFKWLMDNKKDFIIVGNKNAISYKEVFLYLSQGDMWLGCTSPRDFVQPDTDKPKTMTGLTRWFTNLEHKKRREPLLLTEKYSKEKYPKYDNYDAIEVSNVNEIPCDYYDLMGVPITFMDSYNPNQFEIVGISSKANNQNVPKLHDTTYYKGYVRGNTTLVNVDSSMPILKTPDFGGTECSNGVDSVYQLYWRIFIRRRANS